MSVRRDKRWNTWFYRKAVRTPNGHVVRIFGTPKAEGLPETRAGVEEAERRAITRVLNTGTAIKPVLERKEVPTVRELSKVFIETSQIKNKASSVDAKNAILRCHLLPLIGALPGDKVTYSVIEDLKLALIKKTISRVAADKLETARTLSPKTINNCLVVLRRMLVVARKRGLIEYVPDVEWLHAPQPEFDFLDFDEADRLVAAAEGQLRTMILVGLKTGMRQGELLAQRWQDVDLIAGRLTVRQNVVRQGSLRISPSDGDSSTKTRFFEIDQLGIARARVAASARSRGRCLVEKGRTAQLSCEQRNEPWCAESSARPSRASRARSRSAMTSSRHSRTIAISVDRSCSVTWVGRC